VNQENTIPEEEGVYVISVASQTSIKWSMTLDAVSAASFQPKKEQIATGLFPKYSFIDLMSKFTFLLRVQST